MVMVMGVIATIALLLSMAAIIWRIVDNMTQQHRKMGWLAGGLSLTAGLALAVAVPTILLPGAAYAQQTSNGCEAPRSGGGGVGRSILRGVLGAATSRAARSLGYAERFVPSAEVADTLTDSIACHLDEHEQVKAKEATLEATRGETVGTTVNWTSDSRENVRGSSTIVARDDAPSGQPTGTRCMTVDDVIIVNGEETVQQKRMCRVPPSVRYALAA